MKKFRLLFFISVFLLPSCSGISLPRVKTHKKGVDKTFKPFIKSYKNLINEKRHEHKFKVLSMNFTKLESNVIGRCWWLLNGDLEIEIDSKYWENGDFIMKKFLIYHELEHCIRGRMHTNRKKEVTNILDFFEEIMYYLGLKPKEAYLKDRCPISIMHSYTMGWKCRQQHYYYYIKEIKDYREKRSYKTL